MSYVPDKERVREGTEYLTNILCHTQGYIFYQKSLTALKEQQELYRHFKEFCKRRLVIEVKRETEDFLGEMRNLYQEYEEMLSNPLVADFLSAEQEMCILMRMVYDNIEKNIKMDVSYMDEM